MRSLSILAGALALTAVAAPVQAEVLQSSELGFVTSDSTIVKAAPDEVWDDLVEPSEWWNPDHSYSLDAENFYLDAYEAGCFCESLPDDGFAEHMRVIHAAPGKLLRMSGALGPLQSEAITGTLSIVLTPVDGGTKIEWTYVVTGYGRFPMQAIAPAVDAVQSEQLMRLARLVDSATPQVPAQPIP